MYETDKCSELPCTFRVSWIWVCVGEGGVPKRAKELDRSYGFIADSISDSYITRAVSEA